MPSTDDFRFNAHHLLLDLDATTNQLMTLVVSREVSGYRWEDAVLRQKQAYDAWVSALTGIQIDPMPALDGRPAQVSDEARTPIHLTADPLRSGAAAELAPGQPTPQEL